MRKIILVILFANIVFVAFGQQQITGKLTLTADLSQLKALPLKVLIEKRNLGNFRIGDDTSKIAGKIFHYEAKLSEPEFLNVVFYWPNRTLTSTSFWAVASTYHFTIGNDLKPNIINAGKSDFEIEVNALEKKVKNYRNKSDSLVKAVDYENQKIVDAERQIDYIRYSIDSTIADLYKKTVLTHLNSPVGLYALCKCEQITPSDTVEILLNKLDDNIKQMPSAKGIYNRLAIGKKKVIGRILRDISLPDTSGRFFKLSDFKGKYVLVDFWASWCMPCRAESPGLVQAYNKYKKAGFQIISISRDEKSSRAKWLQAIKQDHINLWPQLSDFDNIAQKAYDIRTIPTNYLIDPKGVIIAKDLRGNELEKTLANIFR